MNKQSAAEEVAEILLSIKAVAIKVKEPFRYTNGLLSPVYTDNRLLASHLKERRRVVELWVDLIQRLGQFDVIAGTSTAGIPHAAWISDKMDLPMVYVRGKAKEHGKKEQIEGGSVTGKKTVIVEDLISTGKSSLESHRAISEKGGVAGKIAAIFNYTLPQSKQNFEDAGVELVSLTTFPTVVDIAARRGDMEPGDQILVLDWLKDAAGWGRRHGFED